MTSVTGPDILASWLWRSIRDSGVPGSIPSRGTRREYFLYRSISPPTTIARWVKFSADSIFDKKKKKKKLLFLETWKLSPIDILRAIL